MRLNTHLHAIFLDGVFAPGASGKLVFHPLPSLSNATLADLLQAIRVRVLGRLVRRGVVEDRAELTLLDDEFAEREPALASLARASVSGLAPAGPERRERLARPPLALRAETGVKLVAPLSVAELGYSLHAATTVAAGDSAGREALCKYVLRPPLAQERLHPLDDGLVRIELRRPFRDGTVAVDLDPLSLLCRLAASVPPPRMHLVRYAGVLSSAHRWRSMVVPPPPPEPTETETPQHAGSERERPPTHRCRYWSWARLMKRMLGIDADRCDACGARMKLRALLTLPQSIERFLRHLGEPTEPPALSPARRPPFFQSRAVRRTLTELTGIGRPRQPPQQRQLQMFEGQMFEG